MSKLVDRLLNYTPITPSGTISEKKSSTQRIGTSGNKSENFSKILDEKLQEQSSIKFSAHAMERIKKRSIKITQKDIKNIESALREAEKKGAKEALFVGGKFSLIVSVKNRTVITAIDEESMKNNIFTNIDSAVIL